ncbi:hypothetical protein J7K41_02210, partial [Candidatus Micrarchaeota archaeon]|nr:hypothetical protein [Candidatus Micrarchaeota archaeon]
MDMNVRKNLFVWIGIVALITLFVLSETDVAGTVFGKSVGKGGVQHSYVIRRTTPHHPSHHVTARPVSETKRPISLPDVDPHQIVVYYDAPVRVNSTLDVRVWVTNNEDEYSDPAHVVLYAYASPECFINVTDPLVYTSSEFVIYPGSSVGPITIHLFTVNETRETCRLNFTVMEDNETWAEESRVFDIVPGHAATVTVIPSSVNLEYNDTQDFVAVANDAFGNMITSDPEDFVWSTSLGYIYPNGTYLGNESGEGYVYATYEDVTGNASVTVAEPVCIRTAPTVNLYVNDTFMPLQEGQLTVEVRNNDEGYCTPAIYTVTPYAEGWTVDPASKTVVVDEGGTVNVTFNLTAPTVAGTYILETDVNLSEDESVNTHVETTVHVVPSSPYTIVLAPGDDVTTSAGEPVDFDVFVYDEYDNPVDLTGATVEWSSDGGSIDDNGIFITTVAGDYHIYVNVTFGDTTLVSAAAVHVTPGAMTSIDVQPEHAEIPVYGSVTFDVIGYDAYGNEIHPVEDVLWSSDGGVINDSGTFTATEVGTYTVTANVTVDSVALVRGIGAFARLIPSEYLRSSYTLTDTATVDVTPGEPAVINVTPDSIAVSVGDTVELSGYVQDEYGNVITCAEPSWTVSPSSLGTVVPSTGNNVVFIPSEGGEGTIVATYGSLHTEIPVSVDASAPTVSFVSPTPDDGATYRISADIIINITSDEPSNLTLEWNGVNETVCTDCTEGYVEKVIGPGDYTFRAYATDAFGHTGWTEERVVHVVENMPPVIDVTPANNSVLTHSDTITIDVTDDVGLDYVTYQFDCWTHAVYLSPSDIPATVDLGSVDDGVRTLTVTARDVDGAVVTEVYTYTVSDAPVITLVSPANGSEVHPGDTIQFDITGSTDEEYAWDDGAMTPFATEWNVTVPTVADGLHTLTVRAGNVYGMSTEEVYTFYVTQPPVITLVSPANGSHVNDGDTIDIEVTDNGAVAVVLYSWNCDPETGGRVLSPPYDLTVDYSEMLPDENHLYVYARDNEGLETVVEYTFFGENTLPTVSFDPVNGSVTTEPDQEVEITMHDPSGLSTMTYTCPGGSPTTVDLGGSTDATEVVSCAWSPGVNTMHVEVADVDGGSVSYDYVIVYDADAPTVTLVSPAEGSDIDAGDTIVLE